MTDQHLQRLPIELFNQVGQLLTIKDAHELSLSSDELKQRMEVVYKGFILRDLGVQAYNDWRLSNISAKVYYHQQLFSHLFYKPLQSFDDEYDETFTTSQIVNLIQTPLHLQIIFTSLQKTYRATIKDFTNFETSFVETILELTRRGKNEIQRQFMNQHWNPNESNKDNIKKLHECENEVDYIDVQVNGITLLHGLHLLQEC